MATGRLPDPNSSPLTAKGDLYTYSTVPAKLAVGNNGETLVADSSASTGLRWQQPKTQNAIYNSGFDIAQRGTSFTGLNGAAYTLDRWIWWATTGGQSNTVSQQAIGNLSVTPNQAIRYAGRFGRTAGTSNTGATVLFQTLETSDSIRFAGKAVTLSFYARAGANYSTSGNNLNFGIISGTGTDQIYYSFTGSTGLASTNVTLTTSWQRFSVTGTVATNATELAIAFTTSPTGTAGANDWFEITGVQLEEGSVATAYSRQSATLAGELAACQRYYYRWSAASNSTSYFCPIFVFSGTAAYGTFKLPQTMRISPSSIETSGTASHYRFYAGGSSYTLTSVPSLDQANPDVVSLGFFYSTGGLTGGQAGMSGANVTTSAYVGFVAEL